MNGQAVMTTHLVIVLIGLGVGVLGWVLHKVGTVLKDLLEALAVIAVVFLALFAVIKGIVWVVRTVVRFWRTSLTVAATVVWLHFLGWPSLAATLAVPAAGIAAWWLYAWRTGQLATFDAMAGRRLRAWWLRWWLYA